MERKAIVIGGSVGGLFAAAMLRTKGWTVDVFEQSPVELSGRGAGIVTHQALLDILDLCGAGTEDLGVHVQFRTGYDRAGKVIRKIAFPQILTSWGRLHTLTRATIPDEHYHLDCRFERYEQSGDGIVVRFTNGRSETSDLLVGADGFRSAVRGQMYPDVQPEYAGYVTSSGYSFVLGKSIMLGWLYYFDGELPSEVTCEGRPARRVDTPFYDKEATRARA